MGCQVCVLQGVARTTAQSWNDDGRRVPKLYEKEFRILKRGKHEDQKTKAKGVAGYYQNRVQPSQNNVQKKKDNSANLGRYLHAAKLPSGSKIGASTTVKMSKQKRLKMRAQKGAHLNV